MAKTVPDNFIERAARQILGETLGFEEAQVYFSLLIKKESDLEQKFSYSKKYRLLKRLFELGAIGKFKSKEQDFFKYFLLPPSFLYSKGADISLIGFLEELYLKSHSDFLSTDLSQIILKDETGLLLFLIKYFMKEKAKIKGDKTKLKKIMGKETLNIDIIDNKESKRRIGIIDRSFAFEFVDIPNHNSCECIGYLVTKDKSRDRVNLIESELI